jgi:ribose/xylose/arabinose/galactoside ABC-type transport system permease subunit
MILASLAGGVLIGVLHAGLIHRLALPPFVATLGTMAGLRSLASIVAEGSVAVSDDRIRAFGKDWYVPVAIFAVEIVLCLILMQRTSWGRQLQAMGGNEEAARLSGLPIGRLKLIAYGIGSLTATLAGLVYLGHVGAANSNAAVGYELSGIAAAVIGGCNLKGGAGSILGIMLGCVLLRLVINGTLFVIPQGATDWEGLIVGVVVILAVLLGRLGAK